MGTSKRVWSFVTLLLWGMGLLAMWSCQRWFVVEVREPSQATVPVDEAEIPLIQDDMDLDSLKRAVLESLNYLERLGADRSFRYGSVVASLKDVQKTLLHLLRILDQSPDPGTLGEILRREFLWFQAAGKDSLSRAVLLTGYYLPQVEGRTHQAGDFLYPLYALPPDAVEVDLGLFRQELRGQRILGRIEGRRLVPYYTRSEIDREGRLSGKGLEIFWLRDPIERFFLHIQGSGEVLLEDGRRICVNHAGTNGHPYRSIGRILIDRGAIPKERMSMQAIRQYLLENPEEMEPLFMANPSYVFFRVVPDGPLGHLEVPLTPGRSIATDSRLFPPAALAVLCSSLPQQGPSGGLGSGRPFCRLVLNQDTGGAIRGAARVDLYCGSGEEAEFLAGHLQNKGRLYFLLLRNTEQASGRISGKPSPSP